MPLDQSEFADAVAKFDEQYHGYRDPLCIALRAAEIVYDTIAEREPQPGSESYVSHGDALAYADTILSGPIVDARASLSDAFLAGAAAATHRPA